MPRGEVHTVNRAGLWRNELKGELRELSKHTSKARRSPAGGTTPIAAALST
jgi:hypothetical protein